MTKIIFALLLGLLVSVILMPLIIKITKRISCAQTILKYVEEHKSKQGTPTMGGVVFFITTFLLIFFFLGYQQNWFFCLMVGFGFALVGGLDDYIKIRYKRNLGLKPYQKIIGQLGISLILALYVYYNVSSSFVVPFFNKEIYVGWLIVPIVILTCLATTNSVNLTDGLDGLAGSVSVVVFCIFIAILGISYGFLNSMAYQLAILVAIFVGSILGFLVFNTNKASIFMGDVGSLGIGGLMSAVFCVTKIEFSLLILGIMFVASTLSVIIQVFTFKKFKKRIFKMSPLHHHFQQCGFSEAKITYCYSLITFVMGLLLIISYL